MNTTQRKRLNEIISTLEGFKDEIGTMASDEQEKFDNLPEGLRQQGEWRHAMESAASALQDCDSYFDDIINGLQTAMEG